VRRCVIVPQISHVSDRRLSKALFCQMAVLAVANCSHRLRCLMLSRSSWSRHWPPSCRERSTRLPPSFSPREREAAIPRERSSRETRASSVDRRVTRVFILVFIVKYVLYGLALWHAIGWHLRFKQQQRARSLCVIVVGMSGCLLLGFAFGRALFAYGLPISSRRFWRASGALGALLVGKLSGGPAAPMNAFPRHRPLKPVRMMRR